VQGNNLRIEQQLAGLVLLAGMLYLATLKPGPKEGKADIAPTVQKIEPAADTSLNQMFPPKRIEAIKRKALKRYKARQDEQWRRWLEGVSR